MTSSINTSISQNTSNIYANNNTNNTETKKNNDKYQALKEEEV